MKRTLKTMLTLLLILLLILCAAAGASAAQPAEAAAEDLTLDLRPELLAEGTAADYLDMVERTFPYRSTVRLRFQASGWPSSYSLAIIKGLNPVAVGDSHEVTYDVKNLTSSHNYILVLLDTFDRVVMYRGEEVAIYVTVTPKTDFFSVLISLFQGLFGLLPYYEWEFGI